MPLRISARFMPDCMAAFLTKYSHFRGEVDPPQLGPAHLASDGCREHGLELQCWWNPLPKGLGDLALFARPPGRLPCDHCADHRKPISMKKGRTHNSPDHALRPEERRSGGRLHHWNHGRLEIGMPGRLQIGRSGRLRRYPESRPGSSRWDGAPTSDPERSKFRLVPAVLVTHLNSTRSANPDTVHESRSEVLSHRNRLGPLACW